MSFVNGYDPYCCNPCFGFGNGGGSGSIGATGLTGATGPSSVVTTGVYAYIYNLTGVTVAIGAPILYSNNGVMTAGITHTPGSSTITVTTAGTYKFTYSESGAEPNQFALFQNGVVVPGSIYGSGAGTQQNTGNVIVTVAAGDVFTVLNHSSAAAVGLSVAIGGTESVANASVLIERLGA